MNTDNFENLIFVVGQPRSGTTWVGKIFDSHPSTLYRHEPDTIRKPPVPPFADIELIDSYRHNIREYARWTVNTRTSRVCSKTPFFPKGYLSPIQFQLYVLSAMFSKFQAQFRKNASLLYCPRPTNPNVRVVWKSINSVGCAGIISKALNGSRRILIIRHPCGQIASLNKMTQQPRSRVRFSIADDYPLFELMLQTDEAKTYGLTIEHLQSLTAIERLAWRWVIYNDKALNELAKVPGGKVVHYEEVCQHPERMTRLMFDHAGLSMADQTLKFLRESTGQQDDSYFSVFKNPLDSAFKWKQQLTDEEIKLITSITDQTPSGKFIQTISEN